MPPPFIEPERDPTSLELRPRFLVPDAALFSFLVFCLRFCLSESEILSMLSMMSAIFPTSSFTYFFFYDMIYYAADSARRWRLFSKRFTLWGDPISEVRLAAVVSFLSPMILVGNASCNLLFALSKKLFDGTWLRPCLMDASVLDLLIFLTSGCWVRSISGGVSSTELSLFCDI